MRYRRHISCIVAVSLIVSMTLLDLAATTPAVERSRASVGPLHDPSTPLRAPEQPGPIVLLRVRALVPEKIKLSDPAQGIVRATVLALDEEINQITVQTDEGQRLMLFLPPASLARLRIGAPFLLQVANGATRDSSSSPARDEAFW